MHVSVWGGGAELHNEGSPRAWGLSLDQRLASHHPSFTLQSQKASYCDFLEWDLSRKFREEFCLHRGTGQGWPWVICAYGDGCYGCRTQGSTEGRLRPETSPPKDTGPVGYWPAHWEDQISVPAGNPALGANAPIPQGETPRPPTCAVTPATARPLAGEPESGNKLPPLQGESALTPARDSHVHDD